MKMALDLSTCVGAAWGDDGKLEGYVSRKFHKQAHPDPNVVLHQVAQRVAEFVGALIAEHSPEVVYIEQTNLGKSRWEQKQLEFIHFAVISLLLERDVRFVYTDTSEWRGALELRLTVADKSNNKLVKQCQKDGTAKKDLGVKGKVTWKHLSVRYANEKYALQLLQKDNDIADAICILTASFIFSNR